MTPAPPGNSTTRQSLQDSLSAMGTPIASTVVGLIDAMSQSLRLIATLAIAGLLATSLGCGLYFSGQAFKQAVQATRHAVRSSATPQSLSRRLQTPARKSQTARQQLTRDLMAVRNLLKLEKRPENQRTTANN